MTTIIVSAVLALPQAGYTAAASDTPSASIEISHEEVVALRTAADVAAFLAHRIKWLPAQVAAYAGDLIVREVAKSDHGRGLKIDIYSTWRIWESVKVYPR